MGGFPGLNLPQQVAAPQGVQGGVVGPNPSALNRDPHADQIVKGMSQLVQGIVTAKQGVEQHYGQKVDDLALRAAQGLITPEQIDWKQVAGWMKKSGRAYNTDQTPAELQYQQQLGQQQKFQDTLGQAQQGAQQLASQASGLPPMAPGPMGSPGQPGVGAPGVVAPPSPAQAAPPGFMDRVRMLMGQDPRSAAVARPSMGSPAVQQMQMLAQAGQTGGGAAGTVSRGLQDSILASNVKAAAGKLGTAHDQALAPVYSQVFQKALSGDIDSTQMLRRLDVFKGVPIDEAASLYHAENPGESPSQANAQAAKLLLWQQGGGPALQLRIADMAKDMIPRFGGDASKAMGYVMGMYSGQPTGLQPGRTPEEFQKFADGSKQLADRFPAAPAGLIEMYANAKVNGQDELAKNTLDFLSSHYKTTGQVSASQFQQSLTKDYAQIASTNQVGNREADASMLRAYTNAIDTLEEPSKEILKDPNAAKKYTQEQITNAYKQLNDMSNSLAGTPVKIGGVERPLAPLQEIMQRNNVQTHWIGMGPTFGRNVLPTPAPSTAQPLMPGQGVLSPQDYQLMGLPNAGGQDSSANALQQLLMGRAGAQ